MSNNTGGPAFPQAEYPNMGQTGMTLRDYFAAKAMQAFVSRKDLDDIPEINKANRCYFIADVMLEARNAAQ
jgi:hypothetical protein